MTAESRVAASTIANVFLALGGPPLLAIAADRILGNSPNVAAALPFDLMVWGLLVIVLTVMVRVERQPLTSIGLRPPNWASIMWGLALVFVISFLLVPAMTGVIDRLGLLDYEPGLQRLRELPVWYRVFLAITAGFVEEPLYRGYAVERLAALTGSYWLGGAIAVIAFGLAHIPSWGIGPALVTFVAGIAATLFYVWKRDLVALILAHVMGDTIGLVAFPPNGSS